MSLSLNPQFSESTLQKIISVTTTTADAKLQILDDLKINLFTLSHYLDEYGNREFREIGKITMNFGRQLNPVTLKRIFFTAVWFRLSYKDHNLCLKFWGNGSLHIAGMKDHVEETVWLTRWIARFFDHIESKQMTCHPCEDNMRYGLLVCEHCIVWSKTTHEPIGWVPSPALPAKHQSIGLHGKPVVATMDATTNQLTGFVTTKGSKQYFDRHGDEIIPVLRHESQPSSTFRLPMTNHPFQRYTETLPGRLEWRITCINAKCERSRDLHNKRWLSRDHFTHYMQRIYKDVLTSFDPLTYKAVHLTFFHAREAPKRSYSTSKQEAVTSTQKLGEQIGTVGVTSTGLFWLYGFKDVDKANERAHHMVMLLKQYRSHLTQTNKAISGEKADMIRATANLSIEKPLFIRPVARRQTKTVLPAS